MRKIPEGAGDELSSHEADMRQLFEMNKLIISLGLLPSVEDAKADLSLRIAYFREGYRLGLSLEQLIATSMFWPNFCDEKINENLCVTSRFNSLN